MNKEFKAHSRDPSKCASMNRDSPANGLEWGQRTPCGSESTARNVGPRERRWSESVAGQARVRSTFYVLSGTGRDVPGTSAALEVVLVVRRQGLAAAFISVHDWGDGPRSLLAKCYNCSVNPLTSAPIA